MRRHPNPLLTLVRRGPLSQGAVGFLCLCFFVLGLGVDAYWREAEPLPLDLKLQSVQVCFTPGDRCLPLILKSLNQAKISIHMQAYAFTSPSIGESLLKAHRRGVEVIIIADKHQQLSVHSQVPFLQAKGVPVYYDTKPALAHSKVILIDGQQVITGSYNFTQGAETRNTENLLLIQDPGLASRYEENFQKRIKLSIQATRKDSGQSSTSLPFHKGELLKRGAFSDLR